MCFPASFLDCLAKLLKGAVFRLFSSYFVKGYNRFRLGDALDDLLSGVFCHFLEAAGGGVVIGNPAGQLHPFLVRISIQYLHFSCS